MKVRRSLLFGLGVMLTLSMSVPAAAAPNEQVNVNSLEASADAGSLEDEQDGGLKQARAGENDIIEGTKVDWEKDTSTDPVKWKIKVDDNAVTGTHLVKVGEDIWYVSEDYVVTGFQNITAEKAGTLLNDAGSYFFSEEGNPEEGDEDYGKLLKEQWAQDASGNWKWLSASGKVDNTGKTGWQQIEDKWFSLDADGKPAADKTGWQETATATWYNLKADGTVDTTQNGIQKLSDGRYILAASGKAAIATGWQEVASGTWYNLKADGTRDTTQVGLKQINGSNYYLNNDGVIQTGFQTIDGKQYYFNKDGKRLEKAGWNAIDGKPYYFNAAFEVTTQNATGWQTIDGQRYYFENGKMATGWKKLSGKWYYLDPANGAAKTGLYTVAGAKYYSDKNGAMYDGGWNLISGTWYYMQNSGAVSTGWLQNGGKWYWLGNDGAMRTGWYDVAGKRYFSDASGAMKTGWQLTGGKWYYLTGSGAMATGWAKVGGTWYFLNNDGSMATGWLKNGGAYYYLNGSGAMATRWMKIGNYWYYFNNSGALQTKWYQDYGTWYYSDSNGHMLTGWQQINGTWYYLGSSGAMAANKWVDGYYYVNGSGAMVTNTWVGQYYVGKDGRWIPGYNPVTAGGKWVQEGGNWYYQTADGARLTNRWQKINENWFWFDTKGVMATGWKYIGGLKYYFNASGHMVQDLDSVIGRQSSYYITVNRAKNQVMVYAKDSSGKYVIPCKTFTCSVGLNGATPTGTYNTLIKYPVKELMGPSWGKWATRIVGGVLFHSVACGNPDPTYSLPAGEYNKLGQAASHGCIRLNVRDAKWIYDNCAVGTTVRIGDNEIATPFEKPATIKIPLTQNWDPTDPAVKR